MSSVNSAATTPESVMEQPGSAGWPRITLVTPVFNSAACLEQTISSVLSQGYPNPLGPRGRLCGRLWRLLVMSALKRLPGPDWPPVIKFKNQHWVLRG